MRSSFPEAEVTRSLSSNLLKKGFTKLSEDDARVIDTNELVAKRIRELSAKMQKESNTGFVDCYCRYAGIRHVHQNRTYQLVQ